MSDLREIPYPEHLYNMTEFRLLDEVSEKQMAAFDDEIQARHDDLLITTATRTGIARREKILGILPDPDDSLEARRTVVLFWWYNRMPYTRRFLEGKIKALCGEGNYTFNYDPISQELHVGVYAFLGWDVIDTVRSLLDKLVMLNVILDVKAIATEVLEQPVYLGAAEVRYMSVQTLSDNACELPLIDYRSYLGSHHWEAMYDMILKDM